LILAGRFGALCFFNRDGDFFHQPNSGSVLIPILVLDVYDGILWQPRQCFRVRLQTGHGAPGPAAAAGVRAVPSLRRMGFADPAAKLRRTRGRPAQVA